MQLVIPKVFHRVWLGKQPMPGAYERYWASWKLHHPGWSFVTWTDAMLPPLRNQAAFDAAKSVTMRADIVRYELLYAYGGVYVDADFEALRNIDPLIAQVDCFAAWEDGDYICNAILGAAPHHAIMHEILEAIPESIVSYAEVNVSAQTGPGLITRILASQAGDIPGLRLFQPDLFYPYSWREPEREADTFPNAYAVHHWTAGWVERHRIRSKLASTRLGAAVRTQLHRLKARRG